MLINRFATFDGRPASHPLFREMDQLFRDLAANPGPGTAPAARTLTPAAEVVESAQGLTLTVDLPGHAPEGIEVRVENDTLTVRSERKAPERPEGERVLRAERPFGTWERAFVLPPTVDTARVEARFEHGVLTLTLPRREEARPRTIPVKVQA